MNNSLITVGIVGLGRAGWNLHLQPMLDTGGYKIVSVADPVAERRQEAEALTGCGGYASIDELLKASDAQLIVVATPSNTHFQDIKKVLDAGRHCVAEKPFTLSSADADVLVELAKAKGVHLFVHHAHLHRNEYSHLKKIIESGKLGPIFHLRTSWVGYSRRWDWQTLKRNGGGQLNNTCPHVLSLVLPLLGSRVVKVYSDLRNIKDAGDAEDHVHVVLRAENEATADVLVSTAIAIGGPKWIICGKYGTLSCDGEKSLLKYYDPAQVEALSVADGPAVNRQYLREALPWKTEELLIEATEIKPFHANILDVLKNEAVPVVSAESAADVVRVSEMCHAASS